MFTYLAALLAEEMFESAIEWVATEYLFPDWMK